MPDHGKVVTFYSYRGGIGRTTALANVAWIMARNGLRVLAVDWDLESPGLSQLFGPYADESVMGASHGVVGLIDGFTETSQDRPTASARRSWLAQYVRDAIVPVEGPFPDQGRIHLLPAGRQEGYANALANLDWHKFYEEQQGATVLSNLRDQMIRNHDYVLVDARAGAADGSRTATVLPPDTVVICFPLTRLGIENALPAVEQVEGRRRRRSGPRILPMPFRVGTGDGANVSHARDLMRSAFTPYLPQPPDAVGSSANLEIPQQAAESEEIVVARSDLPPAGASLAAAFERLASVITEGDTDPGRRTDGPRVGVRGPGDADVLISYASADVMWSEWAAAELERAGLHVVQQSVDASDEDAAAILAGATTANRVLILLSASYLAAPIATEVWKLATNGRRPGSAEAVVAKLDNTRVPVATHGVETVDLEAVDEETAAASLRQALAIAPHQADAGDPASARPRFPRVRLKAWNVATRNGLFTGRAKTLDLIRQNFDEGANRPQALCGLAGVGKTELALEYAHRFAADYDIIWWISGEEHTLVQAGLFSLAETLRIGGGESPAVSRLREALVSGTPSSRWLVIFDAVEAPNELEGFATARAGHILVTSADMHWGHLATVTSVGVFERGESVAYLRRHAHLSDEEADRLAERLGDMPSAVDAARAFMTQTETSVDDYLSRLDPAHTPWLVSLDLLAERMPAAARALEIFSFLEPEPIPQAVLSSEQIVSILIKLDSTLEDRLMLGRITNEIRRLDLAKVDSATGTIQIHRLVQAATRDRLTQEQAGPTRDLAFKALAAANPGDPDNPLHWPLYDALWPHVSSPGLLDADAREVRQLVLDMIRFRYKHGDYVGSEELAQQAAQHWAERPGPDDLSYLQAQQHRASALRRLGSFAQAREIDEQTLAGLRRVAGDDNPHTLMVASGLAADLRALGEYAEAVQLDLDAWSRHAVGFGEADPRTLNFASNLADSYRMAGDFARAAEIDHETYERRLAVLSDRHPFTAFSANNYGRDLRDLGDLEGSRHWLERALQSYQELQEPDHPDTLRAAKNLAVTLRRLGLFDAAHQRSLDARQAYVRKLGRRHPETLVCMLTLATTYAGIEEDRLAHTLGREVTDDLAAVLGPDHAYTLIAQNNLAVFELKLGNADASIGYLRDAHDKLRAIFGDDHAVVLMAALNVANHHARLGRYVDALLTDKDAHDRLARQFQADHPDALAAAINLAISRRAGNEEREATELMERTRALAVAKLGPDHPRVKAAKDWQRWLNTYIDPPPM